MVEQDDTDLSAAFAAAHEKTLKRRAELLAEYGLNYGLNMEYGKVLLASFEATNLPEVVLVDGTRLGDLPEFVRFVVSVALGMLDVEGIKQDFDGAPPPIIPTVYQ